jgi:methionyl-tRNA synthetase
MRAMSNKYYITTPIYYVNDLPHIGHTYSTVAADILKRYHKLLGKDSFLLVGTDENSQKSSEAAGRAGLTTEEYVQEMSTKWEQTWQKLGISYNNFIRTTSEEHKKGVYDFFTLVEKKGDIYKGEYIGLYCKGCEAFVTEKELVDNLCPIHKLPPEEIKEENYFFRLSKYKEDLLKLYQDNPEFIQPESRRREIINYVQNHLEDISISRQGMDWGIPFPTDEKHRIYVWFDALINYLTGIGYGTDDKTFEEYWPANLQIVGKDIIKFHCALWPAMLMSAGLPLPEKIFAHGFFTINGQKIGKSTGNSIDPVRLTEEYGFDALRYYLFTEIKFGGDGDFSEEKLREKYNSDLANGLGNLTARVAKLAENSGGEFQLTQHTFNEASTEEYQQCIENLDFQGALQVIWQIIRSLDKTISDNELWKFKDEELITQLRPLIEDIRKVSIILEPFLPDTAKLLQSHFTGPKINALNPIFPRK